MQTSKLYDFRLRPLYFLGASVLIQILGLGLAGLLLRYSQTSGTAIHPLFLVGLVATIGLFLSKWLTLPTAWRFFNFLIVPSIVAYLSFELPSALLLLVATLLALIYLPTFWTGVPYYPTSPRMYQTIAEIIEDQTNFKFIDLGCGFGGVLNFLAKKFPHAQFVGVEISPLAFFICKIRFLFSRRVTIKLQSLWGLHLAQFDYVYAFLAPGPMPKLWEKVKDEMRAGSCFMTNTFEVEVRPDQVIEIEDGRLYTLNVFKLRLRP